MSDERGGGFVEHRVLIPRRIWERVRALGQTQDKEPSEVITDALRLLLAGGVPAAPASVGGTVPEHDNSPLTSAGGIAAFSPEGSPLASLRQEPIDSPRLRDALVSMARRVERRDQSTRHAEAVAEFARALARAIGVGAADLVAIELAALGHDLGKGRIPGEILGKRGRLTAEEWQLVRKYPELGAEMLRSVPSLADVANLVRQHQERWDGSGYPDGLAGDAIPIGAQITGLCDVYDVLTSERAYRPALSSDIARRTIEGGAGRLWNPDLARAFLTEVLK